MVRKQGVDGGAKVECLIEGNIEELSHHKSLKQMMVKISQTGPGGTRVVVYIDDTYLEKVRLGDAVSVMVFIKDK